jgi:DNA-binding GntR family transcriptional regulator
MPSSRATAASATFAPGGNFFVRELSARDVDELYALRLCVERHAAVEAARRLTHRRLRHLRAGRQPSLHDRVGEPARDLAHEIALGPSPRRGFFVRELSARDVDELYALRLCVERHAAVEANRRSSRALPAASQIRRWNW